MWMNGYTIVWDGAKSLGWAPECDLVINKPSK